ncbi:hypothetical protein D0869_09990 [Hortaea werneckii]|uniref:Uncharacterized protein n=1 Tax=Hortaea werneckii TaxID=91943 RepID=A0A3M6WFH6_HORWE|nr:hypothetical protein D0869_09990 [Hortaea werneckii]RMX93529.1 hypothetical protein D0867_14175 [Hortaea werneckii]
MFTEKLFEPLSPPTSPRMSDTGAENRTYHWQHPSATENRGPSPIKGIGSDESKLPHQVLRPPLRSHRSFPYSLGPSSRLQHEVPQEQAGDYALSTFREQDLSQGPQPAASSALKPATYGGSAPNSPGRRLTPHSPEDSTGEQQGDAEEMDYEEPEQGEDDNKPPMTAAELRAQKRKMKRFRRAKLKRLTTDDRERMMRSRALPADFDMTQALHSPFGAASQQGVGTPMPSPGGYFGQPEGVRPLTLDTLRRVPDFDTYGNQQYISPSGVTPALGAFNFTPPQSATDTMSPSSAASNFTFQNHESPRRPPFGMSVGSHPNYPTSHTQLNRPYLHERLNRGVGEQTGSPLRTSVSYSNLQSTMQPLNQPQERAASLTDPYFFQARPQRSFTGPAGGPPGPYGLGFSYNSSSQSGSEQQQPYATPSSGASSSPSIPDYRRTSSQFGGPPIAGYPQFSTSPYAGTQASQYPSYTQYAGQAYPNQYQQQPQRQYSQSFSGQTSPQTQYGAVTGQRQNYGQITMADHQEQGNGNSVEGGAPLPPSYE